MRVLFSMKVGLFRRLGKLLGGFLRFKVVLTDTSTSFSALPCSDIFVPTHFYILWEVQSGLLCFCCFVIDRLSEVRISLKS